MPWHLDANKAGCSGVAVVKDADGSIAGCHDTEAEAKAQLAALYANEPEAAAAMTMPEDMPMDPTPGMPDPQQDASEFVAAPPGPHYMPDFADGTPCWGVALAEGIPDGSTPRRVFEPGMVTFAPTPFSIMWQPETEDGHDESVVVGRVDAIWRDGSVVRWVGCLDSEGAYGAEVMRLVDGRFLTGVSPMTDDIDHDDVEVIYEVGMGPGMEMMQGPPGGPQEYHYPGKHNQKDHGRGGFGNKPSKRQRDAAAARIKARGDKFLGGDRGGAADGMVSDGFEVELESPDGPVPEMLVFHAGRIRSMTILPEQAFVEACIWLGTSPYAPPPEALVRAAPGELAAPSSEEPLEQPEPGEAPMTAAAVGSHKTTETQSPWDGPAQEKSLPSPMPVAKARKFYAWIDDLKVADGQITKDAGKFGHHEVSGDGTPGAANIKACQSGIGVLNGGRGGTTIPAADEQGVYNHLARHLRDAGLEPPPLGGAMTAAAYTLTIPDLWPEWWFQEPSPEEMALCASGAVQVTPEGRVFGIMAPDGVDHRGFRGSGRPAPRAPRGIDYSEWQNKGCIVAGADGNAYKINAGTVTFDCGHASPLDPRRADPSFASQHYDNSCSVAMRARCGENRYGTWFAGGLVKGLTASSFQQIMGCALSGDWQGGKLKAALLVPVEGFPQAVTASVRERMGALVASSVPLIFDAPAPEPPVMTYEDWREFDGVASARFDELAAERFREFVAERFDELTHEIGGR